MTVNKNSTSQPALFCWSQVVSGTQPLLMLHGHGGDHRGLRKFAEQFDRTVYIVDLPGFGSSPELQEHSMEAYVNALKRFITTQAIAEYDLLGHSLGSAIALALAADDDRVKKLILVNPVPEFTKIIRRLVKFMGDTAARLPEKTSEALIHADLYNLVTFLLHSTKRRDIAHAKHYLGTQKTAQYSLRAWREAGEAIYTMDQVKFAKRVTARTLLIHGDKDKMTTFSAVESFAHIFRNAQLKRLPRAAHFVPLENIEEAVPLINKFLNEQTF